APPVLQMDRTHRPSPDRGPFRGRPIRQWRSGALQVEFQLQPPGPREGQAIAKKKKAGNFSWLKVLVPIKIGVFIGMCERGKTSRFFRDTTKKAEVPPSAFSKPMKKKDQSQSSNRFSPSIPLISVMS